VSDNRLLENPKDIFEKLFHYSGSPESWYELGYKLGWNNLSKGEALKAAKARRLDEINMKYLELSNETDDQLQITDDFLKGWADGHGDQMTVRMEFMPLFDKYFRVLNGDGVGNSLFFDNLQKKKLKSVVWK
jgi:hypothetical protein